MSRAKRSLRISCNLIINNVSDWLIPKKAGISNFNLFCRKTCYHFQYFYWPVIIITYWPLHVLKIIQNWNGKRTNMLFKASSLRRKRVTWNLSFVWSTSCQERSWRRTYNKDKITSNKLYIFGQMRFFKWTMIAIKPYLYVLSMTANSTMPDVLSCCEHYCIYTAKKIYKIKKF